MKYVKRCWSAFDDILSTFGIVTNGGAERALLRSLAQKRAAADALRGDWDKICRDFERVMNDEEKQRKKQK